MNTERWTWTTADGLRLQVTAWQPQDPPKAVIALLHGLGSHMGRLAPVAEALCTAGYAVAAGLIQSFSASWASAVALPSPAAP